MQATHWPVQRVRKEFIEYFSKTHNHARVNSSPCVPYNDPSLLFTNAGMNQFKSIFTNTVDPTSPFASLKRAVNSQKCIRAGGKHNDLDDVGKDTYHHTFFEMLGTWSFGDYFKKEAICWAYDILVNTYKLDSSRLYASYFAGDAEYGIPPDEEAKNLWLQFLPKERVLPFDKAANFWEMGDCGPCGPCTEIHYDRIGGRDASSLVNADDPNVIEIWNLVFIQYNRDTDGKLKLLPNKHIDTGMGLERLTSILQKQSSNYDTDVFSPLIKALQMVTNAQPYSGKVGAEDAQQNYRDTAYRIIVDHVRTLSFAIADGAIPSNEGRGYVLRRILRRAIRYGVQNLGAKAGFLQELIPILCNQLRDAYPELSIKQHEIIAVVKKEEDAFVSLLSKVILQFSNLILEKKDRNECTVSGKEAFYFYDTLGFPIDLLEIMASEHGLQVDILEFQQLLKNQKLQSREALELKKVNDTSHSLHLDADAVAYLCEKRVKATNDEQKYEELSLLENGVFIEAILANDSLHENISMTFQDINKPIGIILNSTMFYSESGGQVSDVGKIEILNNDDVVVSVFNVVDVQTYGGFILHTCVLSSILENDFDLNPSTKLRLYRDNNYRSRIEPNHSMTHVLNFVLRELLGNDVEQKGSLVTAERLRFDFSHARPLTIEEIENVELSVNSIIRDGLSVRSEKLPLQKAQKIPTVRALFGEIYPDPVRVVSIGRNDSDSNNVISSVEFCGGTHVRNTNEAVAFCILEESAVGKGIRRVIGISGVEAAQVLESSEALLKDMRIVFGEMHEKPLELLEENCKQYRLLLENGSYSCAAKSIARSLIEETQRYISNMKELALSQSAEKIIPTINKRLREHHNDGSVVIIQAAVGSNSRVLKKVIETIRKEFPKLSVFFINTDSENSKLMVLSLVNPELQKHGLKADEWLSTALHLSGGKGGGKTTQAQGSCNDANAAFQIAEDANKYCEKYLNKTAVIINIK